MHTLALTTSRRRDRKATALFGILKLAYKLLVNDKAKFTALLIGVTFAVFLMVVMARLALPFLVCWAGSS
jgi:hypothetical protein